MSKWDFFSVSNCAKYLQETQYVQITRGSRVVLMVNGYCTCNFSPSSPLVLWDTSILLYVYIDWSQKALTYPRNNDTFFSFCTNKMKELFLNSWLHLSHTRTSALTQKLDGEMDIMEFWMRVLPRWPTLRRNRCSWLQTPAVVAFKDVHSLFIQIISEGMLYLFPIGSSGSKCWLLACACIHTKILLCQHWLVKKLSIITCIRARG